MNPQLIQYIQKNLNAGYDANTIRNALTNHGFPAKEVDSAINDATSQAQQSKGDAQMANINMKNPLYGGFWIRFSAMFWDSVILGIPAFIIQNLLVSLTGMYSMSYLVTFGVMVIIVYMDGIEGGTPGKLLLGLRIRNEKGEFIGIPLAILRYIGKILSGIILGIGYLMIAWTKRKQGLHDKIAGTFVIKEPNVERKGLAVTGIVLGLLFMVGLPIFMIGSLTYFGVMSPKALLPERCSFGSEFECRDFKLDATDGQLTLTLVNNVGESIVINKIETSSEGTNKLTCSPSTQEEPVTDATSLPLTLTQGKQADLELKGCPNDEWTAAGLIPDQMGKVMVTITYYSLREGPNSPHQVKGDIFARVEK